MRIIDETYKTLTVEMTVKEHRDIVEDQKLLRAMEALGVDNWEGYEEALNSIR